MLHLNSFSLPKSVFIKCLLDLSINLGRFLPQSTPATNVIYFVSAFVAADVNLHLETGMQMLMKGQLNDALSHYHLAVGM